MQIFNHPFINARKFCNIKKIEEIDKTPSNATILMDFDQKLISYCKSQGVIFTVRATSIKDLVGVCSKCILSLNR